MAAQSRQRVKFLWAQGALIDARRMARSVAQQAGSMGERMSTVRTCVGGVSLTVCDGLGRVERAGLARGWFLIFYSSEVITEASPTALLIT